VDISSASLEARIGQDGASGSFPNTPQGIAALAAFCHAHQVELVAMEATGGYEKQPFALLSEQGLGVAILNPRSVRRFAEGMGLTEKTDALDAGLIAWFAEVKHSRPQRPPSGSQQQLRALVTRLRQVTQLRTAQLNQSRLVTEPALLDYFNKMLDFIATQIQELETDIARLIQEDPLWQQLDQAFRSIKGVADRTVARLMADLPEIGAIPNKSISKLAGLAPLANDSGKHQGKRAIGGGRSTVREILFVVAGIVARYEPDFLAFQQRLTTAGKPKKVIRIALAHKLLIRLNAKARDVRQQLSNASSAPSAPPAIQPA
jgi:transposase